MNKATLVVTEQGNLNVIEDDGGTSTVFLKSVEKAKEWKAQWVAKGWAKTDEELDQESNGK